MNQAPLPQAFGCPRCNTPANPSPEVIRCTSCGGAFTLLAGAFADASVVAPHPEPGRQAIKVRSPGVFVMRYGVADVMGIAEGMLDPVIGAVPVDSAGVAYPDVVSIAVWRAPAWIDLVAALVISGPITLILVAVASRAAGVLVIAAFFGLITAFLIHRAFVVKACRARIIGRWRTITVRFDRPGWRRARFHEAIHRRSGMTPPPMP